MEIKRRRYYSSSWLDLPQHLMEQILECLPFTDYIRFAGVRRLWETIQKEHRLGHAHALSVPPTLPIPWLIMAPLAEGGSDTRLCYSPLENNRLYSLQIPGLKDMCCLASSHGWLLLTPYPTCNIQSLQFMCTFVLLNPISGRKIKLPQLKLVSRRRPITAAISCAPTDTKSCVIMIISMPRISLCRVGDPNWTVLYGCRDVSSMILKTPAPIFCGGKFYCTGYLRELMVTVEPLPTPEVDIVEMDTGEMPPTDELNLVESNGEILSVVALTESRRRRMIKGYQESVGQGRNSLQNQDAHHQ